MLLTLQIYSRPVYHIFTSTDLVPRLKTETAIVRREAGGGASACIYSMVDVTVPVVAVATPTAHAQNLVRSETKSK